VLLGSTAEKVVRHAPCPVFVVREKEREFVLPKNSAEKRTHGINSDTESPQLRA
jgi:hypothetical protein